MDTTEIFTKVAAIIADKNEIDVAAILPENTIREDLEFDSLDSVELCMEIEQEFNVKFEDKEMEGIITVQNIVELVEKKLQK